MGLVTIHFGLNRTIIIDYQPGIKKASALSVLVLIFTSSLLTVCVWRLPLLSSILYHHLCCSSDLYTPVHESSPSTYVSTSVVGVQQIPMPVSQNIPYTSYRQSATLEIPWQHHGFGGTSTGLEKKNMYN